MNKEVLILEAMNAIDKAMIAVLNLMHAQIMADDFTEANRSENVYCSLSFNEQRIRAMAHKELQSKN